MNNQIIFSPTYRNYPINTQNGTMGCYDKTLEKIYNILLGANKKHARIIVVRFDLHYPLNMIPPQDNHLFSNMMRNFMEKLRISDACYYIAVRERGQHDRIHYHVAVICNGINHRNGLFIKKIAEDSWGRVLGCSGSGLIELVNPQNGNIPFGFKIERNDEVLLQEVFYWLSYMAKVRTKGTAPYRVRELFTSEVW